MSNEAQDRFLRACRRLPVDRTPVWFMRQAGRYLPEYRKLREDRDILDLCRTPELAVEATLQPLRRMPLDAAILFSDIMVPVAAMGIDVRIEGGRGPVVDEPIRSNEDVWRLHILEPRPTCPSPWRRSAASKGAHVPLIGFAGAPFTLASYLIEGGPSRDFARTKAFMHSDLETWNHLMGVLARSTEAYLRAQVHAGAQAVQVFDSWAGRWTRWTTRTSSCRTCRRCSVPGRPRGAPDPLRRGDR
jgi:uroporphyrinogen decarboxylase